MDMISFTKVLTSKLWGAWKLWTFEALQIWVASSLVSCGPLYVTICGALRDHRSLALGLCALRLRRESAVAINTAARYYFRSAAWRSGCMAQRLPAPLVCFCPLVNFLVDWLGRKG